MTSPKLSDEVTSFMIFLLFKIEMDLDELFDLGNKEMMKKNSAGIAGINFIYRIFFWDFCCGVKFGNE